MTSATSTHIWLLWIGVPCSAGKVQGFFCMPFIWTVIFLCSQAFSVSCSLTRQLHATSWILRKVFIKAFANRFMCAVKPVLQASNILLLSVPVYLYQLVNKCLSSLSYLLTRLWVEEKLLQLVQRLQSSLIIKMKLNSDINSSLCLWFPA